MVSNSVLFTVLLWAIPSVLSLLRVLVILFSCYLLIWSFCCVLSVPTFYSNIVFPPVVSMSSCILLLLVGRILFWKVLFWLYCLILSQYLLGLLSFAKVFWFISVSCILRFVHCFVWAFLFHHIPMYFPSLASCDRNFFTFKFNFLSIIIIRSIIISSSCIIIIIISSSTSPHVFRTFTTFSGD